MLSRTTGSVALEANARNIATDVYSASAVLVGLAIVRFTGPRLNIIDPILAIGVAIYIVKVAIDTIRKPVSGLLDEKLPPSQQSVIEDMFKETQPRGVRLPCTTDTSGWKPELYRPSFGNGRGH